MTQMSKQEKLKRAAGNPPCKERAYFQSAQLRRNHGLQAFAVHAGGGDGIQIHGGIER